MKSTVHQLPSGRWFWMVDNGNPPTGYGGTTRTRRSAERKRKRELDDLNAIEEVRAARDDFRGLPRRGEMLPRIPPPPPDNDPDVSPGLWTRKRKASQ